MARLSSRLWPVSGLVLLPLLALAQPPKSDPQDDVQDVVFFSSTRPISLRLHLRLDGKPYRAGWDDYISQLFDYLDSDGDGVLDEDEAARAPRPQLLQRQLRGDFAEEQMMKKTRPTAELGVKLLGGKVKRQGLATYYRLSGLQAFILDTRNRDPDSDRTTEALLRQLDTDSDGKLSKAELQAAEVRLRLLDLNDDEVVGVEELVPPDPDSDREAVQRRMRTMQPRGDVSELFYIRGTEDDASRVPYRCLWLYDKDNDQKLTPKEIGFAKELFDQLDTNRDGKLTPNELEGWLKRPPDLELTIRLGQRANKETALEMKASPEARSLGAVALDSTLTLLPEDARLDWRVLTGPSTAFSTLRQTLAEQFAVLDADQNGYLDEKEAERVPLFQALYVSADADGNGKLTVKEFDAYLDMQAKAVNGSSSLSIRDHGRALFATLDANGDGRLGVREMRSAWARLSALDRDGDGLIAREELPRQFHLTLTQGPPAIAAMMDQPPNTPGIRQEYPLAAAGPLWFRKMDRNRDGDVSRREFLGTPEAFQELDADGDGLIGLEEAERADVKLRKN